jgi:3',5'-cyclic AMP phosphodiesterase CpdA
MRKLVLIAVVVTGIASWPLAGQEMSLAVQPGSLKFAVIGDNGTGATPQFDVGQQLALARAAFPFEIVLMLGDNMYGSQRPADFVDKFERPYAALLQAGVPFYAALGNHDNQSNRFYKGFNMGGERYYTFAKRNVRFFVFDTNLMDATQLAWIENTLQQSQDEWKIAYFHHPLYSDAGRHGSNVELRVVLEPLLVRHGISVVFSGHEHVYQRTTPQRGITYFIEGSSGELRKGDMRPTAMTAASFDQDQTFMLVEIDGNEMRFRTM